MSLRLWTRLIVLLSSIRKVTCDAHEFRLYSDLMKNYNRLERPVEDNTYPVRVTIALILQQIVAVNPKHQIMEVNAWIKYSWNDYKLRWNPADYGGIKDVRFPTSELWRPDVLVYNSADNLFETVYHSNIVVNHDSSVQWIPPGILRTSCQLDIRWFPFDEQTCYIKFGSWTYHGFALDLKPENESAGVDVSEYMTNGQWQLRDHYVTRDVKFYDCCPQPYVDVKFYLVLRRRTLYYAFNLIIPSLVISFMTILGFTLPPDAGEKITLEITILLSVCFFLSIVADMTPPTSEAVPILGVFFTTCMIVVTVSVMFTVIVLNFHYRTRGTHAMSPACRKVLLNWIPWMLKMHRPGHEFDPPPIFMTMRRLLKFNRPKFNGIAKLDSAEQRLTEATCTPDAANYHQPRKIAREVAMPTIDATDAGATFEQHVTVVLLQRILTELRFVVRRVEQFNADSSVQADWKFAAIVVDRLCLIVFTAFIVACTCGILLSAPHVA